MEGKMKRRVFLRSLGIGLATALVVLPLKAKGEGMNRIFMPYVANGQAKPLTLPYSVDFSTLPDGPLPYVFQGAMWAISGGKAVCTPILGPELLPDPGLEVNYTAGLCDSLSKIGSPILAQSADAHGGTKAQSYTCTHAAYADQLGFTPVTPSSHKWVKGSIWGKRTSGTNGTVQLVLYQNGGFPANTSGSRGIGSANYSQRGIVKRAANVNALTLNLIDVSSTGDTVLIDDASLRIITEGSMMALLPASRADVTVKARYAWDPSGIAGVVARANAQTDPNTFLIAYYITYSYYGCRIILDKCVNGTYTNLFQEWGNSGGIGIGGDPLDTEWLEIRMSGSTIQVFHNNSQVGTDQTVTDVPITNSIHGAFQSGGSLLKGFFLGNPTSFGIGSWGDSLTEPVDGYAELMKNWFIANYPQYQVTRMSQALGGNWPWSNLVRYPANLGSINCDLVLCDVRPTNTGRELLAAEALIRRIYTDNPTARIISPIFPANQDGDPTTVDAKLANEIAGETLCTAYDIVMVDYRQAVIDAIAEGANISTYMADIIHPTTAGRYLCYEMVRDYLIAHPSWMLSPGNHSVLPPRVNAGSADYENEPVRIVGTGRDAVTGTWTATGTRIESNETGATITFHATCQSFGLYTPGTYNTVADVQVDGGDWLTDCTIGYNGFDGDLIRGPHTFVVRVRAGVPLRVDEFWAI
jgi:hypothetical protein